MKSNIGQDDATTSKPVTPSDLKLARKPSPEAIEIAARMMAAKAMREATKADDELVTPARLRHEVTG